MRALVLVVAVLGCSPSPAPLHPAGSKHDDGAGVLARMSARFEFPGADEVDLMPQASRGRRVDDDPLAGFGGFGYGGYGYGGERYGGLLDVLPGLGDWSANAPKTSAYDTLPAAPAGAIEGRVTWTGAALAWPPGCASAPAPTAGGPVVGAIAYLERVERGLLRLDESLAVVTAGPCALAPATLVTSQTPTVVLVDNRHGAAIGLAVGDQQVTIDDGGHASVAIDRPGLTRLAAPGLAPAWVMTVAHPYVAVTDGDGRFALDLVPAGHYKLIVWAPPVALAVEAGVPRWSAPLQVAREVVVTDQGVATVAVALPPR